MGAAGGPWYAGGVRAVETELLANGELYREVVLRRLAHARESVWIATANVKEMFVDTGSGFRSVLVDGAWVYLGSANLTGAGLGAKGDARRNFELGFCTEDFEVIDRVTALFQAVWTGAECGACKLRDVCPDPLGPARPPRRPLRLGRARRLRA